MAKKPGIQRNTNAPKPETENGFKWGNVASYIARNPGKAEKLGPWWYTLKHALKARGYDFGPHDDPHNRERMKAHYSSDEDAGRKAIEFMNNAIQFNVFDGDGNSRYPDGEPYFLDDPDLLERAFL